MRYLAAVAGVTFAYVLLYSTLPVSDKIMVSMLFFPVALLTLIAILFCIEIF